MAIGRWLDQDAERPLSEILHDTLGALRSVAAEPIEPSPAGRAKARQA